MIESRDSVNSSIKMNHLVFIVLCSLVVAANAGHPASYQLLQIQKAIETLDVNGNDFLDKMIELLKISMAENGLDPMQLPDQWRNFTVIPVIGPDVYLGLFKGWAMDLTTVYRNGDCSMNYVNQTIEVKADIGFLDIAVTYDFEATIEELGVQIGPKGNIYILVKDLAIDIDIEIYLDTMKAHLNALKIRHTGDIDVQITSDLHLLDVVENAIINVIVDLFKNVIMTSIEGVLKDEINKVLDNMSLIP